MNATGGVVEDTRNVGGIAFAQRADIASEADVQALFAAVRQRYGRVDVVINNAGIGHMKPFRDVSMEAYDRIFATNARGTFMMCREAARGITVNIVSPGMTDTPMLLGGDPGMLRKIGASLAAMKRLGQPEDVADGVAALVSHDGRWITGQNIHVDGGTIII